MTLETSLAQNLYGAARVAQPSPIPAKLGERGPGLNFSDALTEAARMMDTTLRRGEAAAEAAVRGQGDVQSLVEALAQTEMALETAVTIRDRVVEAYQEVLRMPV